MKVRAFLNKTKTQLCIASIVIGRVSAFYQGGRVFKLQAQANTLYLNLGFLHQRACTWYLVTNLAGHLEK
jgi:hypothetical protein